MKDFFDSFFSLFFSLVLAWSMRWCHQKQRGIKLAVFEIDKVLWFLKKYAVRFSVLKIVFLLCSALSLTFITLKSNSLLTLSYV